MILSLVRDCDTIVLGPRLRYLGGEPLWDGVSKPGDSLLRGGLLLFNLRFGSSSPSSSCPRASRDLQPRLLGLQPSPSLLSLSASSFSCLVGVLRVRAVGERDLLELDDIAQPGTNVGW